MGSYSTDEIIKNLGELGKSFGVSLTAATQTFNDARQYSCEVRNDANSHTCASHYDAFYATEYGEDIEKANNQLDNTMDEFDEKMERWMKRFEDSPLKTNERKVRQTMKSSPPPPPPQRGLSEELDELLGMMQESRMNLGDSEKAISGSTIYTPKNRNAFAPPNQVGSIESELNSELMGLKKKYKNLENEYSTVKRENSMLRERNNILEAKVAEYKQKLFTKKKKQDLVKPVKNIFDGIVKWFKE